LYFDNSVNGDESIHIIDMNNNGQSAKITIGRNNGTPAARGIKIGNSNSTNASSLWQIAIGESNNLSVAGSPLIAIVTSDEVATTGNSDQFIYGYGNTIEYEGFNSTSRGHFIVGVNNNALHPYSSILGNNQTTTANNQLIIAEGNPNNNGANAGFNDI